ncbi:PREDICTED: chromobox protein homolog 3-like [Rhagoletis zephyria]|uniref:chromobox protein homolog 3-like n=1 Tax=Rhagoletis zephyria TaxID=28612 RepID=UPI000811297F|nr:PREDICTED: chromobox protein homolog 3-like [Rhagoletis zephyria]
MDQTPKQTGSRRAVPNKTQAAPTDSEEYEVEKVLSKKVIDGTVQYLIKWKEEEGGEKWENSWEPVENLVSFDELKLMSAANIKKVKEEINTWNECFVQNPTCDDEDDDDSDNDEDGDGKDGSAGGAGPSGTSASASSSHLSKKAKLS